MRKAISTLLLIMVCFVFTSCNNTEEKESEKMARIPVALQLYSVRDECAKDFPGTLKKVADMGYEGVEFAGFYDYSAEDLRKILDKLGLKVAGSHTPYEQLLGDKFEQTVAFNKTLGNKFLIVPWLPDEYLGSLEGCKKAAALLNEISDKLAAHGMVTGYHNHFVEFTAANGQVPWEVIFDNTKPAVIMQADTGNALKGGCDITKYIKKYAGRSRTVHIKEYTPKNPAAIIGEGDVNWKSIFKACETVGGTEWYIVEQEQPEVSSLITVKECLDALKKMGK